MISVKHSAKAKGSNISAYLTSKQILYFAFAELHTGKLFLKMSEIKYIFNYNILHVVR